MKQAKGFTLIETMLFISLSAVVTLAIFAVIWNVLEVHKVSERFQASQLELMRAGEQINLLIRNADSVEAVGDNSIRLGVTNSSETVAITLENGVITVERGGVPVALTGDRLGISSLQFTSYSMSDTSARFITYEIYGSSRIGADSFPVNLRGGTEVRSLVIP